MQQYILRRTLLNFVVLFLVATMVFLALRVDPSNIIRERAQGCTTAETYDACREIAKAELGLDKPLWRQYGTYMADLAQLDLGKSFFTKNAVLQDIKDRAGPSIELGLLQIMVALVVALPIGIISAIRQDTWLDYLLRFVSIALLGIPVFVLAIFVMLGTTKYAGGTFLPEWLSVHGTWVNLFPGQTPGNDHNVIENLKRVTGPALVGGLGTGAIIMRFLRSQMLEVLRQDYVRTAWAKGLRERVVVVRHALKNALIPVLTVIGLLLGSIVSGNVVLEYLYTIPGIGFFIISSILQFDYPVVQGTVLVVAVTLVFVNLLVDIAYGWLDPRIRYS
ncbi:MAG: ABC transporter permease [Dehalococcoidia bacterium]|nr:ABC transporter permease [Dehalococcoidia bacterium]